MQGGRTDSLGGAANSPQGVERCGRVLLRASTSPGVHQSAPWPGTDPRTDLTAGVAGSSSQDQKRVLQCPTQLTRLSGFARREAGLQGAALSLWLLPPSLSPDQPLGPDSPTSPLSSLSCSRRTPLLVPTPGQPALHAPQLPFPKTRNLEEEAPRSQG